MKNSLSKLKTLMLLTSLGVTVALTGCAGVKNSMRLSGKDSPWNPVEKLVAERKKESEPTEPVTMVVTWKGSVYETVGAKARGFGGRIFFYDQAENCVAAEGELTVYGFDDTKKKSADSGPDKKFVFRASEFQTHKSENALGVSYSIWIPWEKVGGYRKTISLIPIFKTADGRILKGGQSINVLHGKTPERQLSNNGPFKVLGSSPAVLGHNDEANDLSTVDQGVVRASYQEESSPESRIRTSTINLTPNLARHVESNRKTNSENSEHLPQLEGQSIEQLRQMFAESQTRNLSNLSSETGDNDNGPTEVSAMRQPFGVPGAIR